MIIRLSGLPGSGKSTLGKALSEELDYDLLRIDFYRNRYRDEVWALTEMFMKMNSLKDNFILDSTGFNKRILWVFQFLKARVVDIKLVCNKDILKKRLEEKAKSLPKNEYFPYTDTSRAEYIDDYFEDMAHKSADIIIDTSYITIDVMVRTAVNELNFYEGEGK